MLKNNWLPTDILTSGHLNNIADDVNANTSHQNSVLNNQDYIHGMKFDKESKQLKVNTEDGEVTIGGNADDIKFNGGEHDIVANTVQDAIIEIDNKVDVHKQNNITADEGVHGLRFNKSQSSLQYKEDNVWKDAIVQTPQDNSQLESHINKTILDADGVHGLKYNKDTGQQYYYENDNWHPIVVKNQVDLSVFFNLAKESLDTNVNMPTKSDLTIEGGCYNPLEQKYYINKIESTLDEVGSKKELIEGGNILWY